MRRRIVREKRPAGICSIAGYVLIWAMILICLPLVLPRFFGYEIYAIVSGSMEPAVPAGSAVYVERVLPEQVAEGDIITFYGGGSGNLVTTHRVVENRKGKREFLTKGDANPQPDMLPRSYESLIGRVRWVLPGAGRALEAVSDGPGRYVPGLLLAAAALLCVAGERGRRNNG